MPQEAARAHGRVNAKSATDQKPKEMSTNKVKSGISYLNENPPLFTIHLKTQAGYSLISHLSSTQMILDILVHASSTID